MSDKNKSVVITPDDCKAALEFWRHFKIPVPQDLSDAFSNFISDPTYDNQVKVKFYLTKSIATSDHEAFKDEMFQQVVTECASVAYEMAFDSQLEESLDQEPKE